MSSVRQFLANSSVFQWLLRRLTAGRVKLGWYSRDYASDAEPIIVGGSARSGTTLMRTILNSHPHVACTHETGILTGVRDFAVLAEAFGLPVRTVEECYRVSSCLPEFIEKTYACFLYRKHRSRWAEKDPSSILMLDYLMRWFPKCRYIHMIRDGRDVACSLREHPKYKIENGVRIPLNTWNPIEQGIERWRTAVRFGRSRRQDPRVLEVYYEALVADPTAVLRKVTTFIGEPWHEQVLTSLNEQTDVPLTHPEIVRGINTSARERWRAQLSDSDKDVFKSMANDLLVELGYAEDDRW